MKRLPVLFLTLLLCLTMPPAPISGFANGTGYDVKDGAYNGWLDGMARRSEVRTGFLAEPTPELDSELVYIAIDGRPYDGNTPASIVTDQVFKIEITLRNTGTATWGRPVDGRRSATLFSRDPDYNESCGTFLISPGQNQVTAPGETFSYSTHLRAPSIAGDIAMKWQAVEWTLEEGMGGVTPIPDSFAEKYTGGRTLGLGFGGYYSIGATASYGPALAAAKTPDINTTESALDLREIFSHPYYSYKPAVRDGNYYGYTGYNNYAGNAFMEQGGQPKSPWEGTWTANDYVYSGVFIDLPDKKGYIAFARMGTGRIGYDYGGIGSSGNDNQLYFYDWDTLGKAATGGIAATDAKPSSISRVAYPYDKRSAGQIAAGSYFDKETRRLYVYALWGNDFQHYDLYGEPIIHVYKIKEDAPDTDGVAVRGRVATYNPSNGTKLQLRQGAAVIHEINILPTTDPERADADTERVEQDFAFVDVAAGTYSLVITKTAHTGLTVENIVVGNEDVDLADDGRDGVRLLTLPCGDINGDGKVNNGDLSVLWRMENYNRAASPIGQTGYGAADVAAEPLCDLNGDGLVNNGDLAVLWQMENYNRGNVVLLGTVGTG